MWSLTGKQCIKLKAMESIENTTEERTDIITCFLLNDRNLKGK